ncbi:peroxisomal membrane anchor protein conserved region-domain-containing protein [Thamnocephalis sphaerospora]|uniref:Peroxisomal membrane protein PEX14 n=1 Tax=Thamnocephalis sphaerospora TaxID=78915 RepID=A0A4P9XFL1_9FUNG|nr:peroxisomal membrane anchor protein conserved region-domain-containing protein [Thamnocephalis sphaerospora]|eukprot:RKP04385.1 peroxisomal membrane anchor protein conserved region-domain-containing protein [Thamnocephalis sphaerospora]
MREDLLQSAVNFLKDPKVQSASMGKKVSFLESKGLTSEEIQEAVRRSGTGGGDASAVAAPAVPATPMAVAPGQVPAGYGPVMMHAPPPPPPALGWKDYFIAAVVVGGVGYGAAMLAKRYIGPAFSWPGREELEEDKRKLDAEFEKTKAALEEIVKESAATNERVEKNAEAAEELLEKTRKSLEELGEREEKREKELRQVSEELDRVRDALPKILQQSKDAQSVALNDLQAEIKSLKGLLASRGRVGAETGSETSSPASSVGALGSIFGNSTGRPTIPAWQLAGQQQAAKKPVVEKADAAKSDDAAASSPQPDTATTTTV